MSFATNHQAPAAVMRPGQILKALQLRRESLSYDEIAESLGVSPATARRYVKEAYDNMAKELDEEIEFTRQMELNRLDRMFAIHYTAACAGSVKATEICLKISAQRMALIGGNKPVGPASVTVTQNFNGLPDEELVKLAQARGIPIPAGLIGRAADEGPRISEGSRVQSSPDGGDSRGTTADGEVGTSAAVSSGAGDTASRTVGSNPIPSAPLD